MTVAIFCGNCGRAEWLVPEWVYDLAVEEIEREVRYE